jgi:hypothetical protein
VFRGVRTYRLPRQQAEELLQIPYSWDAKPSSRCLRNLRISSLPSSVWLRYIRTHRVYNAVGGTALLEQGILFEFFESATSGSDASITSDVPQPYRRTAQRLPLPPIYPGRHRLFEISSQSLLSAHFEEYEPDGPTNRCGIWLGSCLPGATSSAFEDFEVSHSDRVASKKSNLLQACRAAAAARAGGRRPPHRASHAACCLRTFRVSFNRFERFEAVVYCWVQRSLTGVSTTGGVNSHF